VVHTQCSACCAEVNETPVTERQPQAGFDAGSGETTIVGDPLRGRVKDTMGNATAMSGDPQKATYE
jgi:hypothetical protein